MMIPNKFNKDIAELCGIIVGDGSLNKYLKNNKGDYKIQVFGDKSEKTYFNHVSDLFNKVFKTKPNIKIKPDGLCISFNSKQILQYFELLGIPTTKKSRTARIPSKILSDPVLSSAFLRGIIDTDGSVNFKKGGRKRNSYPRIVLISASPNLIKDVKNVLSKLDIGFYYEKAEKTSNFGTFMQYRLEINGRANLDKWIKFIGFNNPRHTTKIQVWRKFGFCPSPYNTF